MRVHLHYKTTAAPWGGTNSFARTLAAYLAAEGVVLTRRGTGSDIVLINGAYRAPGKLVSPRSMTSLRETGRPWRWLGKVFPASKRPKLVLRLDGMRDDYAGEKSSMDRVQLELLDVADRVIFQSRYSLERFKAAGYRGDKHVIIPNSVDGTVFHPGWRTAWDGKRPLRVLASSWSDNPAKGHASIAEFARLPGLELRFIGNWARSIPSDGVRVEPPMRHAALADAYRWADAFLFPARRESCPNAALEALASGLPLWYHPEGGTAEIASDYGIALSGDAASDLDAMKDAHKTLAEKVARDRARFTIERSGGAYVALFQELTR